MNKNHFKREKSDHITRIQANLQQMKNQINEYLKKQSNDKTPPILKPRHYLLVSYMNDYHTLNHNQSIENVKIKKELSSEKLGCNIQSDCFQPMRSQIFKGKHQKNKIVKQKRTISGSKNLNKSVQDDVSCLLPNICNLNLQCSQSPKISNSKTLTSRKNILQRKLKETLNASLHLDNPESSKRYHSIDMNQNSHLSSSVGLNTTRVFKMGNKSITIGFPRKHLTSTLSKINFNMKIQDYLKNSLAESSIDQNQNDIEVKPTEIDNLQKEELQIKPSLGFLNEKQNFLKRRFYLKQKSIPPISNLFANRKTLKQDINKSRRYLLTKETIVHSPAIKTIKKQQKNQIYSPWQEEGIQREQKALDLLENEFL